MKAGGVHVRRLPPDPSRLKHRRSTNTQKRKKHTHSHITPQSRKSMRIRRGIVFVEMTIVYSTSRSAMSTWAEQTGSKETNEHKCHRNIETKRNSYSPAPCFLPCQSITREPTIFNSTIWSSATRKVITEYILAYKLLLIVNPLLPAPQASGKHRRTWLRSWRSETDLRKRSFSSGRFALLDILSGNGFILFQFLFFVQFQHIMYVQYNTDMHLAIWKYHVISVQ